MLYHMYGFSLQLLMLTSCSFIKKKNHLIFVLFYISSCVQVKKKVPDTKSNLPDIQDSKTKEKYLTNFKEYMDQPLYSKDSLNLKQNLLFFFLPFFNFCIINLFLQQVSLYTSAQKSTIFPGSTNLGLNTFLSLWYMVLCRLIISCTQWPALLLKIKWGFACVQ